MVLGPPWENVNAFIKTGADVVWKLSACMLLLKEEWKSHVNESTLTHSLPTSIWSSVTLGGSCVHLNRQRDCVSVWPDGDVSIKHLSDVLSSSSASCHCAKITARLVDIRPRTWSWESKIPRRSEMTDCGTDCHIHIWPCVIVWSCWKIFDVLGRRAR